MKLTVILPSAGKGTRLNLPYPKEILRLDNDNALIDNCFNFFKDYGRNQIEFVVVINEDKTDVVKDEYVIQTMRYLELVKEVKKSGNKKQKVI